MADIEQWVNLTANNKWIGDGLTERARMGEIVRLRIRFAQRRRASAWVTKTPDGDNASYSATERRKRLGFRVGGYSRRRVVTNNRGVLDLTIRVSLAGGDSFSLEVEDRQGNTVQSDNLLTRRKLYFQVIRMAGVTAVSAADVTGMKNEFWNEAEKIYIKMIEHTPGQTITARRNFNDEDAAVNREVLRLTRAQYSRSKNPYSFAVLVVKRNGIPQDEDNTDFAVLGPSNTWSIFTNNVLFDVVDPAENYYNSLVWQPDGGASQQIPKSRLTRVGNNQIDIDTTGYTQGLGNLTYSMRVLGINGRGFSNAANNFTVVAAEDSATGAAVPSGEIMAVLIHEIGHKIGMVPGPQGNRTLDQQSTYYDGRGHSGGHCFHGAGLLPTYSGVGGISPDCTMFGDTRASVSSFCSDCRTSIRKLDLRSRTNVGIRTQF